MKEPIVDYSEKVKQIVTDSGFGFDYIKYNFSHTKDGDLSGVISVKKDLKDKKEGRLIGLLMVYIKKNNHAHFSFPDLTHDLDYEDWNKLIYIDTEISKIYGCKRLSIEVENFMMKENLIKDGFQFKGESHIGTKELR